MTCSYNVTLMFTYPGKGSLSQSLSHSDLSAAALVILPLRMIST